MFTKANMHRILRILVILLPVVLMLVSCSKDGSNVNPDSDEELSQDMRSCWQDKVLKLLYQTMGEVAMGMYEKITEGALALVMTCFAIWFVFKMLAFVSSIKKENSGEFWNQTLRKLFVCLFCGILASSTDGMLYVLNTLVFPVYNAFLELGGRILDGSLSEETIKSIRVLGETITVEKPAACTPENLGEQVSLSGFPESPIKMMSCMICAVDERLSLGNQIAFKVLRAPGFLATVNSLIMIGTFTIIKLAFVFYLVDNVFKFAVIVVMLPILIMAYPFKAKWTKFGFVTILTSAAFMMAIALMIAIAIMAVVEIIVQNAALFDPEDPQVQVNDFSAVMLALLLISFLIVGTIKVAKEVVSSLVGGSVDSKFQEKLKGIAMMVVGWFTGGLGRAVAKIGAVQRMNNRVQNSALGRAMQKRQEFINKINKLAGRNQGGK